MSIHIWPVLRLICILDSYRTTSWYFVITLICQVEDKFNICSLGFLFVRKVIFQKKTIFVNIVFPQICTDLRYSIFKCYKHVIHLLCFLKRLTRWQTTFRVTIYLYFYIYFIKRKYFEFTNAFTMRFVDIFHVILSSMWNTNVDSVIDGLVIAFSK